MAFHPAPSDLMLARRLVEPAPEVLVLDRLPVRRLPAVALPSLQPKRDALAQVLRIGVQIDAARTLQRFERRNRGEQLHAVVGGQRLAARQFFQLIAEFENGAPAARAGIARAGAVGPDLDPTQARQP